MPNYQTVVQFREWVMLVAELYVCYILKKEFDYDADKFERQKQRKKRKYEFETLTTGEGK